MSRAVSSSESGESDTVTALRLPPPQPGRRSSSSGRAVQTTSSGTPVAQSTSSSTKSSRPSSAQCRSSKTSTSGPRSASPSKKRRHAANASARRVAAARRSPRDRRAAAGEPSTQAASASAHERRHRSRQLGAYRLGVVASRGCRPAPSPSPPSAQYATPSPYGRRAALAPDDQLGVVVDDREQLADEPALADSRHADERHELWRALLARRGRARSRRSSSSRSRPTSGDAAPLADVDAEARPRRHGLPDGHRLAPCPSPRPAPPSPYSIDARGRAVRRLADEDAVPGAAAWSRAAVLTTSPATIPSPASGRASTATSASPVLTAIAHLDALLARAPIADRERRAHGSLRVVLVRDRRTEDGHDRVADELLHRAAVALELVTEASVVRPEDRAHVLGVERSARDVKPTRSANTTVTTLRSLRERHAPESRLLRRLREQRLGAADVRRRADLAVEGERAIPLDRRVGAAACALRAARPAAAVHAPPRSGSPRPRAGPPRRNVARRDAPCSRPPRRPVARPRQLVAAAEVVAGSQARSISHGEVLGTALLVAEAEHLVDELRLPRPRHALPEQEPRPRRQDGPIAGAILRSRGRARPPGPSSPCGRRSPWASANNARSAEP